MSHLTTTPTETTWEVVVERAALSESQVRARLLEQMRPALEQKLRSDPAAQEFVWHTPLYLVRARWKAGTWRPGSPLRLTCSTELRQTGGATSTEASDLPVLHFPDEAAKSLGSDLVGLDAIRQEVLLRFRCQFDGFLDVWSERTSVPVAPALRRRLEQCSPLLIFHGVPGTGKSALTRVIADDYCRAVGMPGRLLYLGTEARGNGLVGNFSQQVRAGFAALLAQPAEGLRGLVIEEGDALAMRRSETSSHQEDRAATATILQSLDALAHQPRTVIFLTTNLLGTIDPAVLRRGTPYQFDRPTTEARALLLKRWLPHLRDWEITRAARQAQGMTPADIERALEHAYLRAVTAGVAVTASMAFECLRHSPRTRSV